MHAFLRNQCACVCRTKIEGYIEKQLETPLFGEFQWAYDVQMKIL